MGRQGSQAKVGHNQICTVERVLCKVNATAKRWEGSQSRAGSKSLGQGSGSLTRGGVIETELT